MHIVWIMHCNSNKRIHCKYTFTMTDSWDRLQWSLHLSTKTGM